MKVTVNGEQRELPEAATVDDAVVDYAGEQAQRMAVAVNGEVVPRNRWEAHRLDDGDRLEVVAAIQGGAL